MLSGSVWRQLAFIYKEPRGVGPRLSMPLVLARLVAINFHLQYKIKLNIILLSSSSKTKVMSYSTRISMAVPPARSYILRVSYPTLVSTSTPSNRPLLWEQLRCHRRLGRAELAVQLDISLDFI